MESPSQKIEKTSVWLSPSQAQSMEHVGTILEHGNRRLKIMRTADNRLFCELIKRPEIQAATAILLKGIVPVCDIKKVDFPEGPRYYSYMVEIEDEMLNGEQTDEISADASIIDLIFNGEHWAGANLKNIRLDNKHRAVFFDFDQSKFDFTLSKYRAACKLDYIKENRPRVIKLIEDKLLKLKNLLKDEDGRVWFLKAFEHIGFDAKKHVTYLTENDFQERVRTGTDKERDPRRPDNDDILFRVRTKVDFILKIISDDYK